MEIQVALHCRPDHPDCVGKHSNTVCQKHVGVFEINLENSSQLTSQTLDLPLSPSTELNSDSGRCFTGLSHNHVSGVYQVFQFHTVMVWDSLCVCLSEEERRCWLRLIHQINRKGQDQGDSADSASPLSSFQHGRPECQIVPFRLFSSCFRWFMSLHFLYNRMFFWYFVLVFCHCMFHLCRWFVDSWETTASSEKKWSWGI